MAIALISVALLVGLGLVMLELHRRSLRTQIYQLPGGLRFEAQRFSVQIQRKQQEVRVRCGRGILRAPGAGAAPGPAQAGPLECTFAAIGIAVEVRGSEPLKPAESRSPKAGPFDVIIRSADGTQLTIEQVNGTVAASFKYFYLQVRHWIDKLEQRVERERIERLRSEEEAEQARQHADFMAQLVASQSPNETPSAAECAARAEAQIAHWRQAAGFQGLHSLQQTDANGMVVWFIDLAADGRITLHAQNRILHSSLRGASIASGNGELEVGVRDAYWSEQNPELRLFPVLKGRSAEERRAWKERLELLCNSLGADSVP